MAFESIHDSNRNMFQIETRFKYRIMFRIETCFESKHVSNQIMIRIEYGISNRIWNLESIFCFESKIRFES